MQILIVEDDRVIAENLYDFLETCGHRCDFAPSLAAAEALLTHDQFDAMVLDRSLPDGDGLSVVSAGGAGEHGGLGGERAAGRSRGARP